MGKKGRKEEKGGGPWDVRVLNGNYKMDGDKVVVELYGRTRDGRSILMRNHGFRPYFHLVEPSDRVRASLKTELDSGEEVTALEDIRLWVAGKERDVLKVVMKRPFKVPEFRDRFGERTDFGEGSNVLAADIPFVYRFTFDNDLGACVTVRGTKVPELKGNYTVDIVIDVDEDGYEDCEPFHPPLTILSFDIENSIRDKHIFTVCMAVRRGGGDIERRSIYGDEKDILEDFQKLLEEVDPDVVTGYNIDNYDIPVMLERAKVHRIDMAWGRDRGRISDLNQRFWRANGRIFADAWWNAKMQLRPKKETLNAIAEQVLGETKEDVDPKRIDEEWEADRDKVISYCKKDAELALRILEKIRILDKTMDLATVSKLPLDDVINGRTSTLIDSILIREADKGNIGVPMTRRASKTDKIEGGYVHTIEPGVYNWIITLDFKSMYPSIIISNNLCFTTLDPKGEVVSPYKGVRFLSRKRKEGLIPRILARLMAERDGTKAKAKEAKKEGDMERWRYYNGLQDAIKVLMNSFYGVLASAFYRFTDNDIGASITAFARKNVKDIIKVLEEEKVDVIYGDSVAPDSEIVIRRDGMVDFVNISDLFGGVSYRAGGKEYCRIDGVEALTIDDNGKAVFRPVVHVVRHSTKGMKKRMLRVRMTNDWSVDVTEDHSLIGYLNKAKLPEGSIGERMVEVTPSDIGKKVRSLITLRDVPDQVGRLANDLPLEAYEFFGLFVGDGSFTSKVGRRNYYVGLATGKDEEEIIKKVVLPLKRNRWIRNYWRKGKGDLIINGPIVQMMNLNFRRRDGRKRIPDFLLNEGDEQQRGFVRGLFSSDGTVIMRNGVPIIRFTNTRRDLVEAARRLMWKMGISNSIFKENVPNLYRTRKKVYGGRTYSYHLYVKDGPRFNGEVGFLLDRKKERLEKVRYGIQKRTTKEYGFDISAVRSVEDVEMPDFVYDIEVEGTHRFFANGVLVHNTDSIFLKSPVEDLEKAKEFGESLAKRFTREGAVLEFEKIMNPFFTHGAKKRYVGRVKWPSEETLVRGYEIRRTDAFDYQSEALQAVFDEILDGDQEEAVALARRLVEDVLHGKVPVEKLVISRTVKDISGHGAYKNPERMANVQAAKKLVELGYEFIPGMKVSWIVLDGRKVPQEVEPYIDGRDFDKEPDWNYYARRVAASLARATDVFGWGERELLTGQRQMDLFGSFEGDGNNKGGRGSGGGGGRGGGRKKRKGKEKEGPVTLTDFM